MHLRRFRPDKTTVAACSTGVRRPPSGVRGGFSGQPRTGPLRGSRRRGNRLVGLEVIGLKLLYAVAGVGNQDVAVASLSGGKSP